MAHPPGLYPFVRGEHSHELKCRDHKIELYSMTWALYLSSYCVSTQEHHEVDHQEPAKGGRYGPNLVNTKQQERHQQPVDDCGDV